MKHVNVEYFAIFREHAGKDREKRETSAENARELFAEIARAHGFPQLATVKVAINDEFSDWDAHVADGDSVVFIPPVAGG